MAKRYSSLLTKCFRFNKTIPTSVPVSPLSSVIEAIQTIDRLVQTTENNYNNKQQGDSYSIQKTMNIEQIEEMLIKWTHIAHFLVDTYQQIIEDKNLNE
jgi:hypothetical protein